MHHIVASYLQSQAEALQSSRLKNFEKPESLLPGVTKSIASTYDFVAALLSFLGIFFFIGSFVLICLDLNTTFFLLPPPPPLFIANSNGANVVCHSLEPLWAVHTAGTFLLVSSTPRR